MTTDILREMVEGQIPRHSSDRELLRRFADRLWASFCEDMAAQHRRGVEEGERHAVERVDSGMRDALRTISTECRYAMEGISDESDYGKTYLGRVRNIARAALTKSTDDACGGDKGKGDDNGEQD